MMRCSSASLQGGGLTSQEIDVAGRALIAVPPAGPGLDRSASAGLEDTLALFAKPDESMRERRQGAVMADPFIPLPARVQGWRGNDVTAFADQIELFANTTWRHASEIVMQAAILPAGLREPAGRHLAREQFQ